MSDTDAILWILRTFWDYVRIVMVHSFPHVHGVDFCRRFICCRKEHAQGGTENSMGYL